MMDRRDSLIRRLLGEWLLLVATYIEMAAVWVGDAQVSKSYIEAHTRRLPD